MANGNEAVGVLQNLGLSEYEAKCYVALAHLPQGTARDVSRIADVPRSRVYGALDRLSRKGLVDVQRSEPKVFQAVGADTALRILRRQYESYFDTVEESLRDVEPAYKGIERAVWAIENHENVTERTFSLIEEAESEVVLLLLTEEIFDGELVARLAEASERGVSVLVGTDSEAIADGIERDAPGVRLFDSELIRWLSEREPPQERKQTLGRLVMTDRNAVLVSAVFGEPIPGFPEETAVWSSGVDHGFSALLQQLLTREIEGIEGIGR
ncbi:TrmB family transcriptional regulator [Halegenticoccus soli]|uniref:TrmB family transcriptional regulator n=1 Tax=Halegenticoccus soli TaxID=1985678 RepID=UPI000C6D41C9|nr:helix-turn-helix domain-containing protein [Halegenticoccus soli]